MLISYCQKCGGTRSAPTHAIESCLPCDLLDVGCVDKPRVCGAHVSSFCISGLELWIVLLQKALITEQCIRTTHSALSSVPLSLLEISL